MEQTFYPFHLQEEFAMMTVKEMQQRKKDTGLSYEEISERSGVPFSTVQKVLSGITKEPRYQTLLALEKVFRKSDNILSEPQAVYNAGDPGQGHYTLKDYLALPDDQRKEMIDGVFYDMSVPSTVHQMICLHLSRIFADFIEEHSGSCEVFFSPIDVQLDRDDRTIVEPDICIICDPDKIHRERIFGAPDMIVEILSPSTRRKDMTLKMWKYSRAGVREYWLVDPDALTVTVYDFENDVKMSVYNFHDKVPVGIYGGALTVDFENIWKRIQRFY